MAAKTSLITATLRMAPTLTPTVPTTLTGVKLWVVTATEANTTPECWLIKKRREKDESKTVVTDVSFLIINEAINVVT